MIRPKPSPTLKSLYAACKIIQAYAYVPLNNLCPFNEAHMLDIEEDMMNVIREFEELYPLDTMLVLNKILKNEGMRPNMEKNPLPIEDLEDQSVLVDYLQLLNELDVDYVNHVVFCPIDVKTTIKRITKVCPELGIESVTVCHQLNDANFELLRHNEVENWINR